MVNDVSSRFPKCSNGEDRMVDLSRDLIKEGEGEITFVSFYVERTNDEHYHYSIGERSKEASSYTEAFYELAKMLGIGAKSADPALVWKNEIKPRLEKLLPYEIGDVTDLEKKGYYEGRRDAVQAIVAFSQSIVDGAEERLAELTKKPLRGETSCLVHYDDAGWMSDT